MGKPKKRGNPKQKSSNLGLAVPTAPKVSDDGAALACAAASAALTALAVSCVAEYEQHNG
jgi:hypothetical protein